MDIIEKFILAKADLHSGFVYLSKNKDRWASGAAQAKRYDNEDAVMLDIIDMPDSVEWDSIYKIETVLVKTKI